jgi:ferredoxin-nitrite reductase
MIKELEAELHIPKAVRIHWTGCPNSCGQPQVADIGLMGTKVRKNGKTVEGVDLFMGGKVGKEARLGELVQKGIPCEDLKPVLRQLLVEHFDATPKNSLLESDTPSQLVITQDDREESAGKVKNATVIFAKSGKKINCSEEQFILDVAEGEGVEIASSCRSGNCGTCQVKIVEGNIKYDGTPDALKDLQPGMILTCSTTWPSYY